MLNNSQLILYLKKHTKVISNIDNMRYIKDDK